MFAGDRIAAIADSLELITERVAFPIPRRVSGCLVQYSGKNAGPEHGRRESRSLFVRPADDLDRMIRFDSRFIEGAYDFEARQHAQNSVELSARGLGVQVTADRDWIPVQPFL